MNIMLDFPLRHADPPFLRFERANYGEHRAPYGLSRGCAQIFGKTALHIDELMCVFFTEGLTLPFIVMSSEADRTDSDKRRVFETRG